MASGQRDDTSAADDGDADGDTTAESTERTSADLFAVTRDPTLVLDRDSWTVIDANDAALDLLARDRGAVLGADLTAFALADGTETATRIRTALSVAAETGENRSEWRLERSDGSRRVVDVSVTRATVDGADRLIVSLRDVTDQRAVADALRDSRAALRDLHEVAIADRPIESKIDRMLEIGCDLLDVQYGYVTEIDAAEQTILHSRGDHEALEPGGTTPREETYCRRTLAGDETLGTVTDAATEMGDDPAFERFGLACYLGGTVEVDGEPYGTVCFADDEPRSGPFSETERMFVDVLARRIASGLEAERRADELETRQRRLEAVFDTPDAFVGLLDPDGTLVRANEAAREFVDGDPSAHVGDPFWEGPWFSHDADLQARIRACVETARGGDPAPFEAMHIGAEGQAIDVEGTIRPVRDADGEVDVLVAHGNDVTERERRLQEVKRHRERLGTILDNAPLILYVIDEDGVFTESRGAGLESLGLDPGEVVGESAFELYDGYPTITDGIRRALDGETVEDEVTLADKTFQTYHEPIRDEAGNVTEVVGVSQDVTELKRREQELQAWKNRLQTVVENAPMLLFSYDPDGTVTMSQGKGLDAYGLEPGELVGASMYDVFADDPTIRQDARRAADGERVTVTREIGNSIFKAWYRPIERDGDIVQVIGAAIDVTQQQRQERRIAALSDATNELIEARSPEAVGETVMEIAEDVLGQPLSGIWTYDDEAGVLEPLAATDRVLDRMDAADAAAALPTITEGTAEMDAFEQGELRVVEDYATVSNPAVADAPLGTVAFASLGDYGQLHVGSQAVESMSQANQDLVRILASNAEAALERAKREQELASYRQELERSNESLQQFAYIASHDLQEPLRMVSSYVDLLESEYADQLDDEADEYIEFAVDGATRMQSMIEALLQYSRVQTQGEAFSSTDTAAVVEDARQSLALLIDEADATVTVGDLPTVEADRSQLGQVFQNLLENAIEHGGDPPRIEVTATAREDHYEFAVADDGPGVHEDDRETIFEIFKQGHRRDDGDGGTGIGLAVCQRIVHRHGGEIWVDSTPGEGATFRFTIPDEETTTYTDP